MTDELDLKSSEDANLCSVNVRFVMNGSLSQSFVHIKISKQQSE